MSFTPAHFGQQFLLRIGRPLWRQAPLVVFMALLAIASVAVVHRPHSQMGHYLLCWAIDLYFLALLVDNLPRRFARWVEVVVFAVAYGLSAVEVFLFLRFNLLLSPTVLTLLSETSADESSEFLSGMVRSNAFWQTVAIYLPILGTHLAVVSGIWRRALALWRKRRDKAGENSPKTPDRHANSSPRALQWGATAAMCALLLVGVPHWWGEKQALWRFVANTQSRYAEKVPEIHFFAPHYRLLHATHLVRMSRGEVERLKNVMDTARVDSVAPGRPTLWW